MEQFTRLYETLLYTAAVIGQLAFFWVFLALYVVCMIPLAIIVGIIGEGERDE